MEMFLRKTKRINGYNLLELPKVVYSFIYWFAIIIIPCIGFGCYILLRLIEYIVGD